MRYHFPTKSDLACAIARRYTDEAAAALQALAESAPDRATLMTHYAQVFRAALQADNRMCLCGIMSAEYEDLPDDVRAEVQRFNDMNVAWLAGVVAPNSRRPPSAAVKGRALAIFAAIEGAQLVARGRGDVAVYDEIIAAYRKAGLFD